LWDETSPRGRGESKPSRACETPRAERRVGREPARKWISTADIAMGNETPRKALIASVRWAGRGGQYSEEEASSREDEPVFVRGTGDDTGLRATERAGNRDAGVAAGNPTSPQGPCSQHSEEQPTSWEALAGWRQSREKPHRSPNLRFKSAMATPVRKLSRK
jgi:hypothetical protein